MKINFLLFLFFSIGFLSSFQQMEDNRIYWSDSVELKWINFKGKPSVKADLSIDAVSKVAIHYSASTDNDTASVIVNAIFYQSLSWKKNDFPSRDLLNHEQGHFNLTEISARKYRKRSNLPQAGLLACK